MIDLNGVLSDEDIEALRQRTADRQRAEFQRMMDSGQSVLHRVSDAGAKAQTPLEASSRSPI